MVLLKALTSLANPLYSVNSPQSKCLPCRRIPLLYIWLKVFESCDFVEHEVYQDWSTQSVSQDHDQVNENSLVHKVVATIRMDITALVSNEA